MIKLQKKNILRTTLSFFILTLSMTHSHASILELKSLNLQNNAVLKSIRDDVRKSIYTIKSRRPVSNLPELRFYSYTVKNDESFWKILARTSLDMDTLMSINGLASPKEVKPGSRIYICNMRGIILKNANSARVKKILIKEEISEKYIFHINRINTFSKQNLFIPCGKISRLERSLFLGTGFLCPLKKGRRSSSFGRRRDPFNNKHIEFHPGVDIACPSGTKVYASRNGKVVFSGYKGGYGNLVIIEHESGYHTLYGHLKRSLVKRGQNVSQGQRIAFTGNTGRSTGPHLHFEIRKRNRPVNPSALVRGI